MTEQPQGWRVVVIANVLPIAEPLIETVRGMGHDVVAWLMHEAPGVPRPAAAALGRDERQDGAAGHRT